MNISPVMKGTLGSIAVCEDLLRQNIPVFLEMGSCSRVDIIALLESRPYTIQVKTTTSKNGIAHLYVKKSCLNPKYNYVYSKHDVNIFALYIEDLRKILYISSEEALANNSSTLSFRFTEPKNNQNKGIRMACDYESFKGVLRD